MKKTMEWKDPVIIKLSENRGASGAASCSSGPSVGGSCGGVGWGASSCSTGIIEGASGTMCNAGPTGDSGF